ncbi:hypothetical protein SERLADRAFT_456179 [Serpula lacrymans var. lacrymans S7.9]|nr:uncharacterized protein SERLADRAFT_456179 [Serpula lacrymans var. lacrymans S7.9]EGO31280.1 hypothetical protein SERLADRAFT_456179 [Serpula lacrymans var. lacrymans S7.9]
MRRRAKAQYSRGLRGESSVDSSFMRQSISQRIVPNNFERPYNPDDPNTYPTHLLSSVTYNNSSDSQPNIWSSMPNAQTNHPRSGAYTGLAQI